ncbi:hypothetical protein K1720_06880 [Thermococcus argininiproducens]|uniref:Uncharacterized protein n=1 Tax=Thermococcus argininiproducens TaxID=2866384 RepID=A0A9E7M8W0_9EURY|nr:hypothetical protein [Thermococcus argininiproducens]USG99263.1 hypothetical protein K1720_06880 [Thermococcus argininiproducens]
MVGVIIRGSENVINPHHIKDSDLGLAQEIISAYNKLLEESCIGPCYKYRVDQL